MKRVKSACLMQTLHFVLDPKLTREEGIERVKKEVEDYKSLMGYQLKVLDEKTLQDGSIVLSIKKKVSGYEIGNYFDN